MSKVKTKSRASDNGSTRDVEVSLRPLNIGRFPVRLEGMSILVQHNFGDETYMEMLASQLEAGKAKKKGKIPRCPEREFVGSLHWVSDNKPSFEYDMEATRWVYDDKDVRDAVRDGVFGIPVQAFKAGLISSCRSTGYAMTQMRQMVFVQSGHPGESDYAIIDTDSPPTMRQDVVKIANGVAMVRFRGCFDTWSVKLEVTHNRDMITEEQLINLFELSGFAVGVGEGRPERSPLGWGRYRVSDGATK